MKASSNTHTPLYWHDCAWEGGGKVCFSRWQYRHTGVSLSIWWMFTCRQPGDSCPWTHVRVSELWVWMCGGTCECMSLHVLNMYVWVRECDGAAHLLLSTSTKLQCQADLVWQPGSTRHVCRRWSRIDNTKVIFVYRLKHYRDINKLLSHASLIPS